MKIRECRTPESLSSLNYSKRLLIGQKNQFSTKVNGALLVLSNPYDSLQITQGLRQLENAQQRNAYLNRIVILRNSQLQLKEKQKIDQLQGIMKKAHKRFTTLTSQEIKFEKDLNEIRIQQDRELRYVNLPKQKRMSQYLNKLNFLTNAYDYVAPMENSVVKNEQNSFKSQIYTRHQNLMFMQNYAKNIKQPNQGSETSTRITSHITKSQPPLSP